MESVGKQLRTARLQADLSLEQVSVDTRIPLKVLQAIESDDLSQIPSAFFYKSFVRQLCNSVGISFGKLQEATAAAASFYPEPIQPGQGATIIRNSIVRPLKRPRRVRWLLPAFSLATVLVACSGFYAYWERLKIGNAFPLVASHVLTPASQDHAIAQPKAAVPAEPDGSFRVQLSAVERTWLSIKADGQQVYAGTLEVDQTKILVGRQEGQVRTGNAGGVNIVFNGKPIGLAGPHGTIRTVVFTRDNYEVLPEPSHAALLLSSPTAIAGWLKLPPAR